MNHWEYLKKFQRPKYFEGLFDKQLAFILDPAKRKTALCGRRAGKTEGVAHWLIDGALKIPGETSVYIALSQKSARRLLWNTVLRVCARHDIPIETNESQLTIRFKNAHTLWITGCPDRAQCEVFRGLRYWRIAIDEAGSFPDWLEYFVNEVLDPALMDLDGELALVGSPGLIPVGFFWETTDGELEWSRHHWTCLDNPYVAGESYLSKKRLENRWKDDHPTYVREYLGRWTKDLEALIYPYNAAINVGQCPEGRRFRVLSVDLGFSPDPCAFVLGDSIPGQPDWYGVRSWRKNNLVVAAVAAEIEKVRQQDKPDLIVVDEGALGKMIVADLQTTYGIPCFAAEKKAKLATIHEFRGALLAGTVKIDPAQCGTLREEWAVLPWNEKKQDHHENFPDDCSDAALYNRRAHNLHYKPEKEPPKEGTQEAHRAAIAARKRELSEQMRKRQKGRPIILS